MLAERTASGRARGGPWTGTARAGAAGAGAGRGLARLVPAALRTRETATAGWLVPGAGPQDDPPGAPGLGATARGAGSLRPRGPPGGAPLVPVLCRSDQKVYVAVTFGNSGE